MAVVYSRDVKDDERFKVRVGCLEGARARPNYRQLLEQPLLKYSGLLDDECADLIVECSLETAFDSRPICPSIDTSYKNFTNQCNWNEWIEFPVAIRDLPCDTQLVLRIWDTYGPSQRVLVGVSSLSTFGQLGAMRSGVYDLRVVVISDSEQKGQLLKQQVSRQLCDEPLDRLNEFKSNHHSGQMVKIDWLDRLTFLEIEKITQQSKANSCYMYISIEFPKVLVDNTIDGSIVYLEADQTPSHCSAQQSSNIYTPLPVGKENLGDNLSNAIIDNLAGDIVIIPDPELALDNIIEGKHHKLSRSARSCISDKDIKPNAAVRDQLNAIVAYPPTKHLTSEEQDQVWKFRFYLMNQKKALTKFLKCLNWELSAEVKQALELLASWQPIDIQDALELLSPQFQHQQVRRYAVSRLQQAPDEDLLLYLLQLVQALKYENYENIIVASCIESTNDNQTPSTQAASQTIEDTNRKVRSRSATINSIKSILGNRRPNEVSGRDSPSIEIDDTARLTDEDDVGIDESPLAIECDLATFLINRCVNDDVLANYFYWYLVVEIENHSQNETVTPTSGNANSSPDDRSGNASRTIKVEQVYAAVMERFLRKLSTSLRPELIQRHDFLIRQHQFVDKLIQLMRLVAKESRNRLGKIERLKELLADPEALKYDFRNIEPPLALPLDPSIKIAGVEPAHATLFKSQLMPCRLTLRASQSVRFLQVPTPTGQTSGQTPPQTMNALSLAHSPSSLSLASLGNLATGTGLTAGLQQYNVIFKHGDDLRQDQLILQTITLMDKLLRRENLDLKLTPYRVLATSTRHGFVQYVESVSVAEVRQCEGSIQNFFRRHAPAPDAPFGIAPEVMDTYVRSCAGYCVITYLLGVGDRHLDNLLLTKTGKLFHIDFGYILGRDPKPLPPPMKLTREMVEAMGGPSSELYSNFLKLCHTAFLHLRRHSSLILNLFALMVDANVPDIALEPDKTVKKVQDKFRLDLSDEEAVHYMQNLIDISVSDVMAVLVEQIHKIAQYWRK